MSALSLFEGDLPAAESSRCSRRVLRARGGAEREQTVLAPGAAARTPATARAAGLRALYARGPRSPAPVGHVGPAECACCPPAHRATAASADQLSPAASAAAHQRADD